MSKDPKFEAISNDQNLETSKQNVSDFASLATLRFGDAAFKSHPTRIEGRRYEFRGKI